MIIISFYFTTVIHPVRCASHTAIYKPGEGLEFYSRRDLGNQTTQVVGHPQHVATFLLIPTVTTPGRFGLLVVLDDCAISTLSTTLGVEQACLPLFALHILFHSHQISGLLVHYVEVLPLPPII
ncbi:hypothetical protein BDZ97DRAFT_1765271 [Flammula alnicola]|nr:hypothetical protein BDZ97DRAFT_1765271 [Flammula alnicola]